MEAKINYETIMSALAFRQGEYSEPWQIYFDRIANIGISDISGDKLFILTGIEFDIGITSSFISISRSNIPMLDDSKDFTIIELSQLHVRNYESRQIAASIIEVLIDNLYIGLESAQRTIESMNSMFSAGLPRRDPSEQEKIGLLGELYFISCFENRELLINGWHENIHDTFDFRLGRKLVEIKTTTKDVREHNFSYDQIIIPSSYTSIYFISILTAKVESRGAKDTVSLASLYQDIRVSLGIDGPVAKLNRIVEETLGIDPNEMANLEELYDIPDLLLFTSDNIPQPRDIDEAVLSIRWNARLDEPDGERLKPNTLFETIESLEESERLHFKLEQK